ncbi:MAG: hypothetical protein M1814_004862 [Vezdaea aestivalis]|nr:MAG: hypothetical protein M1814_004862 [Vezdaea aestivalis]
MGSPQLDRLQGARISAKSIPVVIAIVAILVVSFFVKAVRHRRTYRDLPGPPHSYIFGHLKIMNEMMQIAPRNAHPHGYITMIHRKYNLGPVFYMDMWPVQDPMVCIVDPSLAAQVTQVTSLKKHPTIGRFVVHLAGPTSLLTTEDEAWKSMRSMFNPGFAAAHLMTLMDGMVDDTVTFCGKLTKHAENKELFKLEEATTRLTVDIIGRVVLDYHLDCQNTDNEFLTCFRKTVLWTPRAYEMNPFVIYSPVAKFYKWWYGRRMNRYVADILDQRYLSQKGISTKSRRKPAIDLALDEFRKQQKEANKPEDVGGTDPIFKSAVQDQMKTFIFAGHDTSSSTLCYAYHLLNLTPDKMKKARDELDAVFGPDIDQAPGLLKSNPQLINQLPYILAIIKETLRLFPAASTVRGGGDDTMMTLDGETYPAFNRMVWVVNHTMSRRQDLYPNPDEFIPERFMPAPDNFQTVPKDAWRPFEKGPRACIGQELAIVEMKVVLALTLRSFDITAEYEEYDRLMGREKPGSTLGGKRGMFGYRAYQELIASAKPVDSMPARVVKIR